VTSEYKGNVYRFGARLTEWREAAGLSQQDLATLMGLSQQAVSEWEKGRSLPRVTRVRSLASHLRLPPEEVAQALAEEGETAEERSERLDASARDVADRLRRWEGEGEGNGSR
jgi:transcriptional regulator with XRE-family HTH domain